MGRITAAVCSAELAVSAPSPTRMQVTGNSAGIPRRRPLNLAGTTRKVLTRSSDPAEQCALVPTSIYLRSNELGSDPYRPEAYFD
jgi:hypothetical protein